MGVTAVLLGRYLPAKAPLGNRKCRSPLLAGGVQGRRRVQSTQREAQTSDLKLDSAVTNTNTGITWRASTWARCFWRTLQRQLLALQLAVRSCAFKLRFGFRTLRQAAS
eukprot:250223-Rhodomonas_salina.1